MSTDVYLDGLCLVIQESCIPHTSLEAENCLCSDQDRICLYNLKLKIKSSGPKVCSLEHDS